MSRRARLVEHREGEGHLLAEGDTPLPVRYILDRWLEEIPTGSGTRAKMQRIDGFVWWDGGGLQVPKCTLQTDDGHQFAVNLYDIRSSRASLYCVR